MKNYLFILACVLFVSPSFAQEEKTILVPLSDRQSPAHLILDHKRGSITIDGYDGIVAIIHVQQRSGDAPASMNNRSDELPVFATEENNTVRVTVSAHPRALDLKIRLPQSCNLDITNQADGEITVNNVDGDLVIDNSGGGVFLNNVSGTAVLSTVEGNIRALFKAINAGQPMAFSSMDGTIEVIFPPDFSAFLKMKSVYGQIIPDQQFAYRKNEQPKSEDSRFSSGDSWEYFQLNEGGAQVLMVTYNGNIYLRQNR